MSMETIRRTEPMQNVNHDLIQLLSSVGEVPPRQLRTPNGRWLGTSVTWP